MNVYLFLQLMHELKRIIVHDDIDINYSTIVKRLKPFGTNCKQIGLNSPDWSPVPKILLPLEELLTNMTGYRK